MFVKLLPCVCSFVYICVYISSACLNCDIKCSLKSSIILLAIAINHTSYVQTVYTFRMWVNIVLQEVFIKILYEHTSGRQFHIRLVLNSRPTHCISPHKLVETAV